MGWTLELNISKASMQKTKMRYDEDEDEAPAETGGCNDDVALLVNRDACEGTNTARLEASTSPKMAGVQRCPPPMMDQRAWRTEGHDRDGVSRRQMKGHKRK